MSLFTIKSNIHRTQAPTHLLSQNRKMRAQCDILKPCCIDWAWFWHPPILSCQENPPFHLPSLDRPITMPKSLHWLGFHLDHHLYFTHHTKILAAKVTRTVRAMRILGNLVKGMSHLQLRTLTLTTVIPILTYRCQLWWGSRFSNSNTNHLQTALNSSLWLICRGFQSTPVYTLQHISHISPIEFSICKLCHSASIQLHRLLLTNPVLKKIPLSRPNINLRFNNLLTKLHTDSSKKSLLVRIAELTNTSSSPTLNPYINPHGNRTSLHTCGSPPPDPLQKTDEQNTKKV